jgi:hypothetical protein
VQKGQTPFTIVNPGLVQAASTLISAAGLLELTTRILLGCGSSLRQDKSCRKAREDSASCHAAGSRWSSA